MNSFRISRLAGWALGVTAMVFIGWLALGPVTLPGVVVPNDLSDLVTQSKAEGYKPPAALVTTCLPRSSVDSAVRKDIKRVTQANVENCNYITDSRQHDAAWGGAAALVAVGIIWAAWLLWGQDITLNSLAFAAIVVGVLIFGGFVVPRFGNWLDDLGIIAEFFWRGFVAALVFVASGYGAHHWHRQMEPNP